MARTRKSTYLAIGVSLLMVVLLLAAVVGNGTQRAAEPVQTVQASTSAPAHVEDQEPVYPPPP